METKGRGGAKTGYKVKGHCQTNKSKEHKNWFGHDRGLQTPGEGGGLLVPTIGEFEKKIFIDLRINATYKLSRFRALCFQTISIKTYKEISSAPGIHVS